MRKHVPDIRVFRTCQHLRLNRPSELSAKRIYSMTLGDSHLVAEADLKFAADGGMPIESWTKTRMVYLIGTRLLRWSI